MTTQDKKPREFWISHSYHENFSCHRITGPKLDGEIHVIEAEPTIALLKEAYEALEYFNDAARKRELPMFTAKILLKKLKASGLVECT